MMPVKILIVSITYSIVFLYYAPGIPPYAAEFEPFISPKGCSLIGPLAPNNMLDNAQKIHENILIGPESIAFRSNDEIYTGLQGGDIVKVHGKNFEKVTFIVNNGPCHGGAEPWQEAMCGRPLGMRFHSDGLLYVADAYLGVFAVDVDKRTSKNIFNLSKPIEDVQPMVCDDLDIDTEGNIYWSDASTVAPFNSALLEMMANPSGRLIKYNVKTKAHKVLLDKLHFANGVQLSPKKDFVLVNDFNEKKTVRYWLKGPKAGTSERFARLPGLPNNIRPKPGGGYYIAIIGIESDLYYNISYFFGKRPMFKKVFCKLFALLSSTVQLFDEEFPNNICKKIAHNIFNLHIASKLFFNTNSVVVETDEDGKKTSSLQSEEGHIPLLSEAQRVGEYIFLGSAFNNYLGIINVNDIGNSKEAVKQTNDISNAKDEL